MQAFRIDGKVALITGASRGFGLEIARLFGQAGASVVLNGRHADTLEARAAELRQEGIKAGIAAFDVMDSVAAKAAVDRIAAEQGHLDILINNAGMNIRKPLAEYKLEEWRQVLDTNLTAAFVLSQAAGLKMAEQGYGRIVNIGSILSVLGRATIPAYTASKHGILGLTKALAAELGPKGVTVNAIAPGYFETELNAELMARPEFVAFVNNRTPVGRWGQPAELAGSALYLVSPAGGYVNGHLLVVDGGMTTTLFG
ncbi:glucose 1-dehydrogenase [Ferrovibrio sp. MS7]|uniref:SDR family NAD(P)-dependent oxidoreductase n=1 Tax=Ferrovibrio plantarum TaxID=3119164 RepID=UPI001B600282|nr:glucose 1-dehydrogenase [Ferrovibrio sp.]